MGRLELRMRDERRDLPMAWSTVIGRHPLSTWRVLHPDVPLLWVELRWFPNAATWAWRTIGDADATRGKKRRVRGLGEAWRLAAAGDVIRLRGVALVLSDPSPPSPFAVEVSSGAFVEPPGLDEHLVVEGDGAFPVNPLARGVWPVLDHGVFLMDEGAWRLHLPVPVGDAESHVGSAVASDVRLALHRDRGGAVEVELTWDSSDRSITLEGEVARLLGAYMVARQEDVAGGWLVTDAAHALWVDLGGKRESAVRRVLWLRGRLKEKLYREGVGGVGLLFEHSTVSGVRALRLAVPARQLEFTGLDSVLGPS